MECSINEEREKRMPQLKRIHGNLRARCLSGPGPLPVISAPCRIRTTETSIGARTGPHHGKGIRKRPSDDYFQKNVIENIPYAEGDDEISEPVSPRLSRQPSGRGKHDDRCHLSNKLRRSKKIGRGKGRRLIRIDPVEERSQVCYARRFHPSHCNAKDCCDAEPLQSIRHFFFLSFVRMRSMIRRSRAILFAQKSSDPAQADQDGEHKRNNESRRFRANGSIHCRYPHILHLRHSAAPSLN